MEVSMKTQPVGGPGSEPIKKEIITPKQIAKSNDLKAKDVSKETLKTFERESIEREIETLHNRINEVVDKHEKSTQETREISKRIFDLEQKLSNLKDTLEK